MSDQGNEQFAKLFSPIEVGPITVKNRVCETTNSPGSAGPDSGGLIDEHFTEHHVAKARGGTAWIGSETWLLNELLPEGAEEEFGAGGAAVRFASYMIPGFVEAVRKFCDAVHEQGAVAVFQLTHLNNAFGASAVPTVELYDLVPHVMTEEHIEFVLNTYAEAAQKALEAGADGLEIHCAHETVPQAFLSPATNKRDDRWGGDATARTLFVREALARIRAVIGDKMALGIRINGAEARQGGYDLLQFREMVYIIAETGLIDFVNVDVGHCWGRLLVPWVPCRIGPGGTGTEMAERKCAWGSDGSPHSPQALCQWEWRQDGIENRRDRRQRPLRNGRPLGHPRRGGFHPFW